MPPRFGALSAAVALFSTLAAHAQPLPINGEVVGMDGRPLAGVEARLFPQLSAYEEARLLVSGKAAEPAATATTDAGGRFRLTAPRPGMWRVVVQSGTIAAHFELTPLTAPLLLPRVPLGKDFHLALWFGPSSRRTASAHWEVGAEPRPAPTEAPSGCKRSLKILSGNRPVAGAVVLAGTVPQELSNALGLLTVTAACSSPREIEIGAADGKRATVQLPEGTRQEPLSVSLRPRPLAHGQVLDAQSGLPVAGALVWPEGEPPAFVVTDAKGGYQAPLPAADTPRLHAAAAGYFTGQETTATSGPQPVAGPTLRLAPAATVAGTVVDQDGSPVAGVRLAALPLDLAAAEPLLDAVLPHGTALSDPAGEFSLRIPAGLAHALEALHPAYAPEVVQIAAPAAGEPVALRLVLKRGITAFGRVVTLDGEPIPGARVALVRAAEAEADEEWKDLVPLRERSATTDGEGRFSMARLAADRYYLGAIAPGYAPTVVRGVQIPADAERHDVGTLALDRAVTLSGRVVGVDGAPVADAIIEASRAGARSRWQLEERRKETTSGADGHFTLTELAPGEVSLWVRKGGATADATVKLPTPEPVEVVLGQLPIRIRLVDEAGKPVREFSFSFELLVGDKPSFRGRSGGVTGGSPHGVYPATSELSLEVPSPGRYRIYVHAEGFVPASIVVDVGPEGLAHPVTMVLSAGGAVAGRVTDADGAPVAGAEVALPEEYSKTKTDGNGSFRFTGVIPGRRTFTASRKGFQTQLLNLEVQPGDNRLDFQLARGVPVSGRVTTAGGSPVAGAAVHLHADPLANEEPEQTASAADGSFTFAGVAPGTYEITATKPGLAEGPGETVAVGSAPVLGVDLRLEAGGAVVGWVKGLDFSALAQVEIAAYSPSVRQERAGARPDYEGKFRLEQLAPGSWTIFATAGAREIKRHVEVSAGGEAHVELEFRSGFRLSGRVTAGGAAAEFAHLVLSGLDNDSLGQMSVEADGTFAFSDLAAGRYLLEIHDYFRRRPREQILEITADRELLIELPGKQAAGRTVDTAGDPVAGVRVMVEPEDASVSSITRKSDADGRFVVPDLVPGPHRLIAAREGYAAAEARITIPEDGDLDSLVLTLSPAALLTLEVAGPTGATPPWIETALLLPDGRAATVETLSPSPGGKFELRGAAPGTYRLLAAAPGSATAATEVTIPGRHPMSLTPPAIVAIRVPALARTQWGARLTVLGENGQPFHRIDDGEVTADWHLSFGSVELAVLPAGTWRLVATSPDGRSWEKQVAVTAGEHVEVVIE